MRLVTCWIAIVCILGLGTKGWPLGFEGTAPSRYRHPDGLDQSSVANALSKGSLPIAPPIARVISGSADDPLKQFLATVLAETENVWGGIFKANGLTYEEPKLVLFSGSVRSDCENVSAITGIFYCPVDHKIYLDVVRFGKLSELGVKSEIGNALLLAREVGHHVQNITGILPKFYQMHSQLNEVDAKRLSVRIELQADCFAGIWGYYVQQKGVLDSADLEEALYSFHELGDDTLRLKLRSSEPDASTYGTSKQRRTWFKRGFDTGKLSACDTFNAPDPQN